VPVDSGEEVSLYIIFRPVHVLNLCGDISQASTAAAASCSELNKLHTDEGRELTSVSMRITSPWM
jgi:hypothetical protein